jgi:pimeloyl-ACP methyl ester carboxylesterase
MRYPDMPRALVVGAAWYKFSESYLNGIRAMGLEGPTRVNLEKAQADIPDLVELWRTEHAPLGGPDAWQSMLRQIAVMFWTPLDYTSDDFRKITAATLILQGDRDEYIPVEQAVEMYRQIPHAELSILPSATRLSALTGSSAINDSTGNELFAGVVLDFLLRHSSSRHNEKRPQ